MTPEKRFENRVKKYLDTDDNWFIKYWVGAKFTKEGIPDILACVKGKFFAVEVKADNGHPTLIQLVTLRKIRSAGGIAVLLYPKDFEHFVALAEDREIGKYWYRENIQEQNRWFDRLNG